MLQARAQWWFGQMRRKVEQALDASAAPSDPAKTNQSLTINAKHPSDARGNMTHDSFQI